MRRRVLVKLLGGQCVDCSTRRRLQFDHRDPATKKFDIGKRLASAPWSVIQKEAAKCALRCVRCHKHKGKAEQDQLRGRCREAA
jgi:hypothetical protein